MKRTGILSRMMGMIPLVLTSQGLNSNGNGLEVEKKKIEKSHEEVIQEIIARRKGLPKNQEKKMSPYAGDRKLSKKKRKELNAKNR